MMLKITTFNSYISNPSSSKTEIYEVQVYIDYQWTDGKPFFRLTDGVSVNWDSSVFLFKPDSFQSTDYVTVANGSHTEWKQANSSSDPEAINQGGLGYTVWMRNSPNIALVQKGTAKFTLKPKSTIYYGSNRHTSINVEYVHNQNILNTVTFSKSGMGITLNLSGLKDSVAKSTTFNYSV